MSSSVDGLVSGLDTTALINQLIAAERIPQTRLVAQRDKANKIVAAYQAINTKLAAVRDAAGALADASGWNVMKASSSAPTVATVAAGPSALGGSLAFNVNQLATAASSVSSGSAASLTSVITNGPLLVSAGGPAYGIRSLGGTGLTLGAHTIKVTQASSGASKTGTTALAGTINIVAGVNDALDVEVDGVVRNYTIAAGSYSASSLATAVQTASGGDLRASVDATGHLVLTTVDEGSMASLRIDPASTALVDLGLTGAEVGGAASVGTNGIIDVDGTATNVTDVRAGQAQVLASGTGGTVTTTFSSGLRLGTIQAKNVDTGDGTLSAVVNAINGANAGVTAAAIQVDGGQYKLQLASASTGLKGAASVDTSSLAMGGFSSIGVAQDASVTVGTGPGAFSVTSSTNAVSSLLPGVTINLLTTGSASVTVSRDADGVALKVSTLVEKINAAITDIKLVSGYDAETKTAGMLMGDFAIRKVQDSLISALTGSVPTSTVATAASAGVSITREGTFTFDKGKFVTAYDANPTEVAKLFQRGGTSASTSVTLASATHKTKAGAYEVVVTQAATQATATGADLSGQGNTITNAETIDIRVGGLSGTVASYNAGAGESLASIANGLNALATANGFALLATVEADALVVRSTGFGANAKFEVRSSDVGAGQTGIAAVNNVYAAKAGTNVAGTIDGVAATGTGRLLTAPPTHEVLAGLSLSISATAAQVSGAGGTLNLGDFTYVPGVAQRAAQAGALAVDVVSGTITNAVEGRKRQITDLEEQIEVWDRRLALRQATLRRQFTAMETALGTMRQQSSWLAGQVNQLAANTNNG